MRILFFELLAVSLLLFAGCSMNEAQIEPMKPGANPAQTANRNGVRETVTVGFWYGAGSLSLANGVGTTSFTLTPESLKEALGVTSLTVISADVTNAYVAAKTGAIEFESGEYQVDWPQSICCRFNRPCCTRGGGSSDDDWFQLSGGDVYVFSLNDEKAALEALLQDQEPAVFSAKFNSGTASAGAAIGLYIEASLVIE